MDNILFNSETKAIRVTLTHEQLEWAKAIGRRRYASQRGALRTDGRATHKKEDPLKNDIVGAIGEVAVLLAMGFTTDSYESFTPINKWLKKRHGMTDVADIEVRSTEEREGQLILKLENDAQKKDNPFVLARLMGPKDVRLVGWILGRDGMHERYWDSSKPLPNFFVPGDNLRGMDELFQRYGIPLPLDEESEYVRLLGLMDEARLKTL